MHVFPGIRWLICGAALAAATLEGAEAAPKKWNILLLISDDLRPELGCYDGLARTPNLDRLAAEGVVFTQTYCPQALCAPSRAALLTGARPDTTKVWDVWTHFRTAMPDAVTLPQLLQRHGWFAQAFGKVYHSNLNDAASWSVPHVMPPDPLYGAPESKALLAQKRKAAEAAGLTGVPLARAIRSGPPAESPDVPDDALVDGQIANLAIRALQERKADGKPFFLAVGFTKPHLPFAAPKKYWDLYDRARIPLAPVPTHPVGAPAFALGDSGELYGYDGLQREVKLDEDKRRWLRHGYLAAISYMDAQAGRVLDELARQGLERDTVVIFWGDNGYKLGDYDAWTKTTNVNRDVRVPLIVRAPGITPTHARADGLVEVTDVYPTLLEILGLPGPPHVEGGSFLPLLRQPQAFWKQAVFTQSPQQDGNRAVMGYSIVTPTHRLTRWMDRADGTTEVAVELYDRRNDPDETRNLAADPASQDIRRQLLRQLAAGWRALPNPAAH